MSKFKNATKKITAVAASAALVSTAAFAGLGDYPNNFVEDGSFNGQVVVGAAAAASDSTAAQSIISDLANEFSADSEKVRITYRAKGSGDSVVVASANDDLNLGEDLTAAEDKFDNEDLSGFLADGMIVDNDYEDTEYDYEQELLPGDVAVEFGRSYDMDDETDVPEAYLDIAAGTQLYTLTVDFTDHPIVAVNAGATDEGLVSSESIEMFGKSFTFDPNNNFDEDLTLFASSNIVTVNQGDKVSVENEGNTYEVEVTGANSDSETAILSVNGVTKSVTKGTNTAIAGLDVYVDEVFVSNVGGDSAAVKLFLGSDEVVLPISSTSTDGTAWSEVEVDGESLRGYEVAATTVTANNWSELVELSFRYAPQDMENEVEYLRVGDSIADPLFGTLTVSFDGPTTELMAGNPVSIDRSSDDAVLTFTNRDNDEYELELFTGVEGAADQVDYHLDLFNESASATYTLVEEDERIILQEGSGDNIVSKVYEIVDIDAIDAEVELRDLTDGSTIVVKEGDEVEDTGAFVQNATAAVAGVSPATFDLNTQADNLGADVTVIQTVYTSSDVTVTFTSDGLTGTVTLAEEATNVDEAAESATVDTVTVTVDSSLDNDVEIISFAIAGGANPAAAEDDEDSDVRYGLTWFGSYMELDKASDGGSFVMYTPMEEVDYEVTYTTGSVGQTNMKTVLASDLAAEKESLVDAGFEIVDEETVASEDVSFDVSSVMTDSEVTGNSDMIVVGGPAVNTVAASLLGMSYPTFGVESGVGADEAVIRYFADSNSVLVYGYEAKDTTAAVTKLNAGGLSGEQVNVQ